MSLAPESPTPESARESLPPTSLPPTSLPPAPLTHASSADLSPDLLPPDPAPPALVAGRPSGVPRTRTSAAWFGVWAGAVVLVLLIIFIAQNTGAVEITFLWMHGSLPLALALLVAGVGVAIVAMGVAAARIGQLRRLLRRRG
jgi:uncharacterized integral membrane protein